MNFISAIFTVTVTQLLLLRAPILKHSLEWTPSQVSHNPITTSKKISKLVLLSLQVIQECLQLGHGTRT